MATKTKAKKSLARKLAVKKAPSASTQRGKSLAINSASAPSVDQLWSEDDAAFFGPYFDKLRKAGF